ncbi:MAG TPA: methyltransferase domain-containing protein [Terriglobales bacterium]|nr:methyltransferase domain-containing protein [Terriglobales bacterium]
MMNSQTSREWNAAEYHRLSAPQYAWGQRVLSELPLRGDERVLDAGCGSGRLTEPLLRSLPRGYVVGVDISCNMVAHAQQMLRGEFGARSHFVAADLLALPFHEVFDGIFSTASFHWVLDHDALFGNLRNALRPGGWLHAQCGGGPNLARLRQRVRELGQTPAFSKWLGDFAEPWHFSNDDAAKSRLRSAGFHEIATSLECSPVCLSSNEQFQDYLRTFILHRHLEQLPAGDMRRLFTSTLAEISSADDPPWILDYWRLNLRARRPE